MAKMSQDIGKFLVVFLGLVYFSACTRTVTMSNASQNYGGLFSAILEDENVSMYIHAELKDRIPIQVVTNDLIKERLEGAVYGAEIQFDPQAPKESAFYLKKLTKDGEVFLFELNYEIEGVKITGNAVESSGSWTVSNLLVTES